MKHRATQHEQEQQLKWAANIVAYVQYIHKKTNICGGTQNGMVVPSLRKEAPILSPRFLHLQKCSLSSTIELQSAYLKPLTIVHLFYFPELAKCPQCDTKNVGWNSWTMTGPRNVHGVSQDKTAHGVQVQCRGECEKRFGGGKDANEEGTYCFATTNVKLWENQEYWDILHMFPP
jgi:hypothetical protein